MRDCKLCSFVLSVISVCVVVVKVFGQSDSYDNVMEFNRMAQSFETALSLIGSDDQAVSDQLDTTVDQRKVFREFDRRRTEATRQFFEELRQSSTEEERKAVHDRFTRDCIGFEKELKEEILLPFQTERLEQAVFLGMVINYYKGDYSKAISMRYYRAQFGLSEKQLAQLKELQQSIDARKSKVNDRCKKQSEEVEIDSRKKLKEILNGEQVEFIQEISGMPLVESSSEKK